MPMDKLRALLDAERVKYVVSWHSPAFTAQEIAEAAHIPGRQFAKTVVLDLDGEVCFAVLPADEEVDLVQLAEAAGRKKAALLSEKDFGDRFAGCELGMMPPFGHLFGVPVYASQALAEDTHISFNAGRSTEVMTLPWADFARLAAPTVLPFGDRMTRGTRARAREESGGGHAD